MCFSSSLDIGVQVSQLLKLPREVGGGGVQVSPLLKGRGVSSVGLKRWWGALLNIIGGITVCDAVLFRLLVFNGGPDTACV